MVEGAGGESSASLSYKKQLPAAGSDLALHRTNLIYSIQHNCLVYYSRENFYKIALMRAYSKLNKLELYLFENCVHSSMTFMQVSRRDSPWRIV